MTSEPVKKRRRALLLVIGLALAASSAGGAFWALRRAKLAREPFFLDDPDGTWATSLAFSPDEEWLVAGHFDGGVSVWSLADRKLVHHEDGSRDRDAMSLGAVAFTSDGLVVETGRGTLPLWQLPGRTSARSLGHDSGLLPGRTLTAHGHLVARTAAVSSASISDRCVEVWDTTNGAHVASFGSGAVNRVAFTHDGSRVVVASGRLRGAEIVVHDTLTGGVIASLASRGVGSLAASPTNDMIALGSQDELTVSLVTLDGRPLGQVTLPTVETERIMQAVPVRQVRAVAFSPDGRTLAAVAEAEDHRSPSSWGGTSRSWLVLWDLEARKPVQLVDSPVAGVSLDDDAPLALAVTFSPSGERVAVAFGNRVYVFRAP